MDLRTRKLIDRYFSGFGFVSIILMALALLILLGPIFYRGMQAYVFRATVEFYEMQLEEFHAGDKDRVARLAAEAETARKPVYEMLAAFSSELDNMGFLESREYESKLSMLKEHLRGLLGPLPGEPEPILPRDKFGATRWKEAEEKLEDVLYKTTYDYGDGTQMGKEVLVPRKGDFEGTALEPLFPYVEEHVEAMLLPRWKVYWGFITQESADAHFFGGIWPEVLGTFYLTFGAMLFSVPMGVIAAIYLVEYARENAFLTLLRTCISTLAGVPSVVFGLFGLAFFINTIGVSDSKSVLAGALTLSLLVLPTVIRASEEAVRAVPHTYREAALSLGATKWRTILTIVLPAALPGILTSIVISMGRAAGETAPIIFTAAVSVGQPLGFGAIFNEPTPALPWNIYNLATEHEAVDEIRHVQYGMVLTLLALVLLLNLAAIIMRARIAKKLKG